MAVYAAYFSYYTILKHHTYHSFAYDLGFFTQYMWSTLHGHGLFYSSILQSPCFAWHFQPILFLVLPLYALLPQAETLLVLQSLIMPMGALPVYWLARDELGARVGVAFAGLYLLYPALHGVNSFDFHPVALAIPILLFCFYAFKTKRYRWGMVLAVLAMMCKENVALVVIAMGFYWLWTARKRDLRRLDWSGLPRNREIVYPLCLSAIGAIWFVVAVGVLIPHYSLTGVYPWFERYGYTNVLDNVFADAAVKAQYLSHLFSPLAFTSLLNPASLLIGLPIFAQNLLTGHIDQCRIVFHYSSLLIPWLFVASIYGVKWLSTVQGRTIEAIHKRLLYILLPSTLVAALLISPSPIALDRAMPRVTSHHMVMQEAIGLIPENASVYTQNDRFPHICQRVHAYVHLPKPGLNLFEYYGGDYDYILADSTSEQCMLHWGSQASLDRLEREYGVYAEGDGVYLYKRGYEGEPLKLGVAAEHKCAE